MSIALIREAGQCCVREVADAKDALVQIRVKNPNIALMVQDELRSRFVMNDHDFDCTDQSTVVRMFVEIATCMDDDYKPIKVPVLKIRTAHELLSAAGIREFYVSKYKKIYLRDNNGIDFRFYDFESLFAHLKDKVKREIHIDESRFVAELQDRPLESLGDLLRWESPLDVVDTKHSKPAPIGETLGVELAFRSGNQIHVIWKDGYKETIFRTPELAFAKIAEKFGGEIDPSVKADFLKQLA